MRSSVANDVRRGHGEERNDDDDDDAGGRGGGDDGDGPIRPRDDDGRGGANADARRKVIAAAKCARNRLRRNGMSNLS